MRLVIISVKDCAIQSFLTPQFVQHVGGALRSLNDGVNAPNKDNDFAKHPDDYELYKLGEVDTDTGVISALEEPQLIARLKDLVRG